LETSLTFITNNHQIDIEALAVVANGLQSIHLWPDLAAGPAKAGKLKTQRATDEGFEDPIKGSTHVTETEDGILGAGCDAL
jgi:hypothetical protein